MIEYSNGKLINMGCTKCKNTFQIGEEDSEDLQGIKNHMFSFNNKWSIKNNI